MQSGARGHQSRVAFLGLLRIARSNIEERKAAEANAPKVEAPVRRLGQDVFS